ncbi:MAG TPA: prolipoprotein diacylglyceryl transferase family protein [Bacteroidia bacterium]|jgi:prolipoprotein diacylglyceryl transferase
MYPSLYYAVKDLLGADLPFLKMVQMFGFFVAIAFLISAYFWTKELKRKEAGGLLKVGSTKILKGQKATTAELITSGLIGFLVGYKLLYIIFNFSAFTEDTQGFLLSTQGNFVGGLAIAALSAYLKYREKEKTKLEKPVWVEETVHPYQLVGNMTLIAAFAGLTGAKIFHNLENWDTFVADPMGALLSFDGLTMYGGLILASIVLIWYGKKNGIPTPHLIDSAAPSLMIGYAVGRIGCHLSGDGDWGINNTQPKPNWLSWAPDWVWSFDYPHNVVNDGVPLAGCMDEKYCNHLVPPVFPTPFYETLMCLFLFVILWKLRKKITTPGVIFCVYLIFNGIERFFIEKIRVNTLYHINGFGFTQAELISTILFILGVIGIFYFRKLEKKKTVVG